VIVVRERTVDKGFIDIKQGLNVGCATGWENKKKIGNQNQRKSETNPSFHAPPLVKIWSLSHGPRSARFFFAHTCPMNMFPALAMDPVPPLASRPTLLCGKIPEHLVLFLQ